MRMLNWAILVAVIFGAAVASAADEKAIVALPGTEPLTMDGDIAAQLVAGVDKFLLRKTEESAGVRTANWKPDRSSAEAYSKSLDDKRKRLAHILGVRDERVPFTTPEMVGTTKQIGRIAQGRNYDVYAIRWPAFGDVHGEGLLLTPRGKVPIADIVAIVGSVDITLGDCDR